MRTKRSAAVIGVVDDDKSVGLATTALLRSANWQVITYLSGNQLLIDARCGELSLVITDIHMPGMDGFALLEAIKQWEQPVPVVFITAYTTQDLLDRSVASGAADFFPKPLDDARLLARIEELLGP
jgi:FixJ family two-component response regulator